MVDAEEGRLSTGVPYLRLGHGPPLLVAAGLSPQHRSPHGMMRRMALGWAAPFAEHFTVYLVNRRPGLEPGSTMSDIAADYASAIENDLGAPAMVHGTSTGGSVTLQLAVDRPDLVRRLVLGSSACRLSPYGRHVQAEVLRHTQAGDPRRAAAVLADAMAPGPLAYPARGVGWIAGGLMPAGSPDMMATIAAEDAFDAEPHLDRVTAPTLVLGGTRDPFYSDDLFRLTAAGVQDGHVVMFGGKTHGWVAGSKVPAAIALGFLLG
ncbi:pimeloyl-ACP methyl ester carboxylesterase [Mumia flava]|uniref:Pimeloyl-ACP methyl ester carboxylesterase n=1 Tax=Mumia flava TaxID=1348852 RepID=A0A2M9B8N0_9ACTN|nr:alpha/beta hydrolase [Mumia flava]PJJ54314.1 pimeloyl-ACP methyl ester carboxylesterase [Mumia flava]